MVPPVGGESQGQSQGQSTANGNAINSNEPSKPPRRKRKNRWGDAAPAAAVAGTGSSAAQPPAVATTSASTNGAAATAPSDPKAKILAMKASIAARLAAAKSKTGAGSSAPTTGIKRLSTADTQQSIQQQQSQPPPAKKAKVYDLDLTTTGPTFKKSTPSLPALPKKKINPYLAHLEKEDEDKTATVNNDEAKTNAAAALSAVVVPEAEDERLLRAIKPRQRHKAMTFVEPGTFIEIAERKRQRAANAEQSGFVSGRKKGEFVESTGMANVYGGGKDVDEKEDRTLKPRADASTTTQMPLIMEWWDMELLPKDLKKKVAEHEGRALSKQTKAQLQQLGGESKQVGGSKDSSNNDEDNATKDEDTLELEKKCWDLVALSNSKTSTLIQHIVPIKPPGFVESTKQPTLYLTKKELKRQRKLRRAEKQRELQDMQAAGLVPPPEPRLTLKNFISVLGDQAYLDPSQMEQKVNEQIQARQRAHLERNEARKLTKDQRREKKAAKLLEDTSKSVSVALFFVKDMSHPYHRAKVDLNAQQNNITGGVLECENPSLSCIICEGGPKAIKRYTRLMLVRMKWKGQDLEEDGDDGEISDMDDNDDDTPKTHKFNQNNKCELVWSGMGAKRMFSNFMFQSCETSDMARKVLEAKGVAHFWDQIMTHASGHGESFNLKLAEDSDDGNSNSGYYDGNDEKIMMEE